MLSIFNSLKLRSAALSSMLRKRSHLNFLTFNSLNSVKKRLLKNTVKKLGCTFPKKKWYFRSLRVLFLNLNLVTTLGNHRWTTRTYKCLKAPTETRTQQFSPSYKRLVKFTELENRKRKVNWWDTWACKIWKSSSYLRRRSTVFWRWSGKTLTMDTLTEWKARAVTNLIMSWIIAIAACWIEWIAGQATWWASLDDTTKLYTSN